MEEIVRNVAIYALPVIFAITLHEAAHAYAARYFGDSTAYLQGRMSLNPAKHIDPVGTILIPIILYVSTSGAFFFGYAKPVPVEWGNLRKPKRDMAWVALAGPGANLLMALMWLTLGILLNTFQVEEPFFRKVAQAGVWFNLVILAFNLLPIPPLDGGRVLTGMLPNRYAYKYSQIEPYGFFIVIGLMLLNVLQYWMRPVMDIAGVVLKIMVLPINILLG